MLPSQLKRLSDTLRSLVDGLRMEMHGIEEAIKQQEKTIKDTTDTWGKKQAEVGTAITTAINTTTNSVPDYEKSQRDKEYRLQRKLLRVTLFAAIAAAAAAVGAFYYAHIARQQLCTMNKQTNLLRDQLKGTQAAHIDLVVHSENDPNLIYFSLTNNGGVIALGVNGHAKACFQSFPERKDISCKTIPFTKSQLLPVSKGDAVSLRFENLPSTQDDLQRLETDTATIEVQSSIAYDDGFGDQITDTFCKLYFVRHQLGTHKVSERNWGDCAPVADVLREENQTKKPTPIRPQKRSRHP